MNKLNFVLKYWKELLLVALSIAFYVKNKMDYAALLEMNKNTTVQYEERIEKLNMAHKEQMDAKDKAIEEYMAEVEILRAKYDERKEEIENLRQDSKSSYERKFREKPEELVKDIQEKFGFDYVE